MQDTPTDCIIDALEIVLENNISFFNNKIFKQVCGTAMGPNHACSYADLAMSFFDKIITSNDCFKENLCMWSRFRDDIFAPWLGSIEQLHAFTAWINSLHPSINFKLEAQSIDKVNYLDCTVYKHDGSLITTMYHKPTSTHAYLSPKSCHAPHIAKNVPYGVAVRCRRLCTLDSDFDINAEKLIIHFIERGYNECFLRKEFGRSKALCRLKLTSVNNPSNSVEEHEQPPVRLNKRCFPLVTTFNPRLPDVSKIISKHRHILNLDPDMREFVSPEKVFATFRRSKTLGDLLINSRFPPKESSAGEIGCKKCDRSRCNLCKNYLKECNNFSSPHTDELYSHTDLLNCQMNYVIYLIHDKICDKGYVGRTENNLCTRWASHKSHIKTNFGSCKVAVHFNELGTEHQWEKENIDVTLTTELSIIIIDRVKPEVWDTPDSLFLKLCKKEIYWQDRLRVMEEFGGLNDREERRMTQKRHSKR